MTEETTKPKSSRSKPAADAGKKGRRLAFDPPPGVTAEVQRMLAEKEVTPAAIRKHLAAEAAELLAPMAGQVRAIVGRRMGFLPTPPAADAVPNGKAEE